MKSFEGESSELCSIIHVPWACAAKEKMVGLHSTPFLRLPFRMACSEVDHFCFGKTCKSLFGTFCLANVQINRHLHIGKTNCDQRFGVLR